VVLRVVAGDGVRPYGWYDRVLFFALG
jgi:hypothetical protein